VTVVVVTGCVLYHGRSGRALAGARIFHKAVTKWEPHRGFISPERIGRIQRHLRKEFLGLWGYKEGK
jgi:hypothetical protein